MKPLAATFAATLVGGTIASSSSISADSKVGKWLLSRARRLDDEGGEGNGDLSWAWSYSLRFEKCLSWVGDANDGDEEGLAQYDNGERLVHFKLCPSNNCGDNCSGGGDYVVDMYDFLYSYYAHKQEVECQDVEANCYCKNAYDDQACLTECYLSAGVYLCADDSNWLVGDINCQLLGTYYDAADEYAANYFFVGPYCSTDGESIFLGIFTDEMCSVTATQGVYEAMHYSAALPYSSKSIVTQDCISCDNNNYGTTETCQRLYEASSGKCESDMKDTGRYHNNLACDFIKGLKGLGNDGSSVMVFLPGIFVFTLLSVAVTFYLMKRRVQRSKEPLIDGEGRTAYSGDDKIIDGGKQLC
ncbi:hypothetical protein ACHAWF_010161 [Thalassiosira exigua]